MEIANYPTDEALMGIAIDEARKATKHGDVPVGALVVVDGRIIARRHNEREVTNDPTAHAELLAVQDAARVLNSWRLDGATVVCTLEPCPMCAGALQQARVTRVVYGAADLKAGACGSLYNLGSDPRLNHEFEIRHGVRAHECAALLSDFFASRRAHTQAAHTQAAHTQAAHTQPFDTQAAHTQAAHTQPFDTQPFDTQPFDN